MKNSERGFIGTTVVIIGVLIIIGLGMWWFMNTDNTPAPALPAENETENTAGGQTQTLAGGLIVEDVQVGTGEETKAGQTLSMHYTGTLDDGTVFDSSIPRGTPFEFTLGAGQVIRGWDQGILGMKVGGKRTLTIPPALGYGAQAVGPIPPNSTLHFEVELLGIK